MYVCICNNVSDAQIESAISQGAQNLRDLQRDLGVATQCGQCANCARGMLAKHQKKDSKTVFWAPRPQTA